MSAGECDLFSHRDVSFVGRPFPVDEADEHLGRLAAWGFRFLRLVVTWEAIEHAGPGLYDEAYIDYLCAIIEWARVHGISVYIDPHQDVWSRFTGGDGAPGWTLEAVGLDLRTLHTTGAAFVHQLHDGPLPGLIWPTNYTKLGAATMFTLFFGGDDFAPRLRVDGEPVQHFLQHHYIEALCHLARRVGKLPNVVGYGSMNEPAPGFIGLPLDEIPAGMLKHGPSPTPFQSMLLGAGYPQEIEVWEVSRSRVGLVGKQLMNIEGARAWLPNRDDVWRLHGVYTDDGELPRILRPDYFTHRGGQPVEFERDYLKPFCRRMLRALHQVDPDALFFFEGPPAPFGKPPPFAAQDDDFPGLVHAPHWYDGLTLFTKHYNRELTLDVTTMMPVLGEAEVRAAFAKQLGRLRAALPQFPTLVGEFGLNYDLDGGLSYESGDFSDQIHALDGYYSGLEANLLSSTQWNYTADNSNARGDGWNGEDLSIWSRDQQTDPKDIHSGGRALSAIVRPYASATAGEPLQMYYDRGSRTFSYRFRHDPSIAAPTEIFIPDYPYPQGVVIEVSDGTYELSPLPGILRYRPGDSTAEHQIVIRPRLL
jgi:hypothetical protein